MRYFSVGLVFLLVIILPVTSARILTISFLCFILEGVECSRETAKAKLKNGVLTPVEVCSESSVFPHVTGFFLPSHSATKLQKRNLQQESLSELITCLCAVEYVGQSR